MAILSTILGGLSVANSLYNIFKKGSNSDDKFGDSLGVLGKFVDSLGLDSGSSPNYEEQAAIQNKLNQQSVQQQLQANKELARYEWTLNRNSIREQNYYNDPSQQMKRLEAAGLNPMLMYGNGATAATMGNQSEVAKYNAPQAERVEYISEKMLELQMMKQYQDVRLTQAQVAGQDLANEHAASVNRVARATEEGNIAAVDIKNRYDEGQISYFEGLKLLNDEKKKLTTEQVSSEQKRRDLYQAQIDLMNKQADKLKKECESLDLKNDYDRRTLENRVNKFAYDTAIALHQANVAKSSQELLDEWGITRDEFAEIVKLAVHTFSNLGAVFTFVKNFVRNPKGLRNLGKGGSITDYVNPSTGELYKQIIRQNF